MSKKDGRWYEREDVLAYIIDSYAGVGASPHGNPRREFMWEDPATGDVLLGNARAFADHVSERFALGLRSTAWSGLHEVLRRLGEAVGTYTPRARVRGGRFTNQEPDVRVVRRKGWTRKGETE